MSKDISDEEVIQRWNDGAPVWTVEMGGMGPGYEQCIQLMAFAMFEAMLTDPFDFTDPVDAEPWADYRRKIEEVPKVKSTIESVNPSGAQFGAAMHIAAVFSRKGYSAGIASAPDDRHIQASKNFPTLSGAAL